jgi:LPXTG-motif cell wall-anchored protein
MKKRKLEGTEPIEVIEEKKESGNNLLPLLGLLGLVGAGAWLYFKNRISIDVSKLVDHRNRNDDKKLATAKSIKELYAMHGQSINDQSLLEATQEYFNLEKSMNSNLATKQIETRLAATSGKGLVYGSSLGLYGILDLYEAESESIYY